MLGEDAIDVVATFCLDQVFEAKDVKKRNVAVGVLLHDAPPSCVIEALRTDTFSLVYTGFGGMSRDSPATLEQISGLTYRVRE